MHTDEIADTTDVLLSGASFTAPGANTTIGVIATDALLTSSQSNRLASVGHDGLARTISPVHTLMDGDTLFALSTGAVPLPASALTALHSAAVRAVELAVIRAVLAARAVPGMPAARSRASR